MINLMYLVLTAMLALNVSSEILNAFKNINDSIGKSNKSISETNAGAYQSIDMLAQMPDQRARMEPYNQKAKVVKGEAEKLYNYLEGLKQTIIKKAGGINPEDGRIKDEGNIDYATQMFVEGRNGDKGGAELKQKLIDTRKALLEAVSPETRAAIEKQFPLAIDTPEKSENNPKGDWAVGNFYHIPVIAAVTMFSKYQNDVRNSEALILKKLMEEANAKVLTFDEIAAIAVPKTSYALVGQKIEANIMLAAYNRTINPEVRPSSGRVVKIQDGVANWETTAAGVGLQTVRGTLSLEFNGQTKTKDWSFQYVVGSTGASIQLDKMNVFYIGIPNPVTVSAAGYSLEDVSLSVPGGQVAKVSNGKYNITMPPASAGKVVATINAKTQDGSIKPVGNMEVRVKFIPTPVAKIGGKVGGGMRSNEFKAQSGILADLENFEFDVRYRVVSYKFGIVSKRTGEPFTTGDINSAYFNANADVDRMIQNARPGDRVFFDDIKALGPDGRVRQLNSITLLLN